MASQHFDGLPDKWEVLELQDVVDKKIVYGIVQAGPHVDGGVPYIKSSNVGGDIDVDELQCTSSEIAEKYARSEVSPGDIVFSLRGNIGETSIVPESLPVANLTQGTARLSTPADVSPTYLQHQLRNPSVLKRILAVAKGSTFVEISLADLRKIKVPMAPYDEQYEIESLFSAWDSAVGLIERLVANSKSQKRALMQQLITGKRRLPGFCAGNRRQPSKAGEVPSDWCVDHLSIVANPVTRKNSAGVKRVLTASGEHGLVDQREYFNRSVSSEDTSGYYHLKKGEFSYNRSSMKGYPYGAIKRLEAYDEGALSTLYLCFELDEEACDTNFLMHLFEAGVLNRQLRGIVQVGARAHGLLNITKKDFFSVFIALPVLEEQRAIAAVLNGADKKTANLKNQLDCLQWQKRALMQQLLTGKRRVRVDKEAA